MPTLGLTGAAGFIGGRVAIEATSRGWDVVGVDDFSGPVAGAVEGVEIRKVDYGSAEGLDALAAADVVLHLAAVSGVVACAEDPPSSRRVNVDAMRRLADRCRVESLPLGFASSLAVVGSPQHLPITEATPPRPTHEYARQKAEGEAIIASLREAGIPAVAARMSNVYGGYATGTRHVAKGNVLNVFAQQARSGVLTVNAPGTQRRDFVHLDDIAAAWLRLAELLRDGKPPQLPMLLFARGTTYSVLDVARFVSDAHAGAHPRSPPLRVDVVPNPRGAIELLDEEFEVDPHRTWEGLDIAPSHDVRGDLAALLASGEPGPAP